ncbi:MAG: response regulator [Bdellovibrionota bacterium]
MSNETNERNIIFAVIDDDDQAREVIVGFLKTMEGAWPLDFSSGQAALDFIKENRIDFIISDWEMPGMDGLELLKHLRINPATARTPFIMVASQMSNEAIRIADAKTAGADAYLIKPFRRHLLMEKISDVLFERRWATRRAAAVIDDDDTAREFIVDAMKQLGFEEVFEAKDGVEGAQIIEDHINEISVVICDWDMPLMSGIQLLRKFRSKPITARIPFIMATAQTPEERKKLDMAIQSEVDHYLLKPFRIKDLKEKVDLVLTNAKSRAQLDHLLSNSQMAIESADYSVAERLFKQILTVDPDNAKAFVGMAEVELWRTPTKNIKEAVIYLEKAIRANPRWDEPHIRLAAVYEKEIMAIEKAIECMKAAIASCHASADLYCNLGRLLLKRGRTDLGIEELKRALELDPRHSEAQTLLAEPSKGKKDK